MAKDRRKLQHIHSSLLDKQPTAASLEVGEIAVNNHEGKEFLSIKNSNDKVVRFSSDGQMIDWVEKKEVIPYSGTVDNVHLDTNRSNIEIKLNQVVAKNTKKYDVVNGAKDIDGQDVNPSSDSGLTNGAGFAIDMSQYAMIGANPSFSSVTVTHRSNLSGTTNISNGAGGSVLNITTTNVNATDTNWTETITNKTSKVTTLAESATTATLSGNTLDITEATRISAKTPSTSVSGTNLSIVETNTDIDSCGRISGKTNAFTVQECAAGSGKTIINQTDIDISGKTFDVVETTSATIKAPATTVSGATLAFDEDTSISAKTPTTNLSGTSLGIIETNTDITSCGRISGKTNAYSMEECATGGTHTQKYHTSTVSGTNLNVTETTSTINSTNTNLTGTNLTIKESATTLSSTTTTISGGTLTQTTTGATTVNVGGALAENVTGTTTINRTGAVTENNKGGLTITTTGKTCMQSTTDVNIGGDSSTNIGVTCAGGVYSNNVGIYAQTGITETANTVTISGTSSVNASGATVNISGTTTNITGATTLNVTGATINVDASTYDLDAANVCVSGSTKANFYGKETNIGVDCGGTTATTINVSGATINEGGTTNNNNFTTINNTATTINNKTTNYNITGTTYISGNTTIDGDLTIPIPCTGITSTTVNNALCETLSRGVVTMTTVTPAATSEILKTYKLWQNGVQIGEDINIPKDHLLKSAEIVYGTLNGTTFTPCTAASSSCHWYIKLVWNVFDPSTGHADDKTTYMPADDFIKDIDSVNPSDNGTAANHNVNVTVWYDGEMNHVSAETTPTMHVTNMYASSTVSAATANITTGNITTLNASATTISGATTINNNLTVTGNTNVSGNTAVKGTLDAIGGLTKSVTWALGTPSADTTGYNGSANKTITIPSSTSHLTKSALTIDYNVDVRSKTDTTYNTEAAATVSIPGSIDHLSNYDGTNITLPHPVNVSGTVTATGAIYSSDRNLKENINFVAREDFNKVKNVFTKSFNFKDDESKRKVYGVIAQEVQEAGLDELVHVKDDGNLGVDYTSLLILKVAYLEDFCAMLNRRIVELEDKIEGMNKKD